MQVRQCYATQRPEPNYDRIENALGVAFVTVIVVLGLAVMGAQLYLAQVPA